MRRVLYLVLPALLLFSVAGSKTDEKYNPIRPDGTLKNVEIILEWDNPDLPTGRRESMCEAMNIRIFTEKDVIKIMRQGREGSVLWDDYMELWKIMKKNKVWELEENALTDPRPIGVPNKTFILKMEGAGQKYFNVDVENEKSKAHFRIVNAVESLCKTTLGL